MSISNTITARKPSDALIVPLMDRPSIREIYLFLSILETVHTQGTRTLLSHTYALPFWCHERKNRAFNTDIFIGQWLDVEWRTLCHFLKYEQFGISVVRCLAAIFYRPPEDVAFHTILLFLPPTVALPDSIDRCPLPPLPMNQATVSTMAKFIGRVGEGFASNDRLAAWSELWDPFARTFNTYHPATFPVRPGDESCLPNLLWSESHNEHLSVLVDRGNRRITWGCECPGGRCLDGGCHCVRISMAAQIGGLYMRRQMETAPYAEDARMTSEWVAEIWETPRLIRECHDGCGCDPALCKNRLSQLPVSDLIEVFRTGNRGWGVKARRPIRRGECVGEYVGERVSQQVADMREFLYDRFGLTYSFSSDSITSLLPEEMEANQMWKNERSITLDGTFICNHTRFFNHSCDPNIILNLFIAKDRDHRSIRNSFIAYRDIPQGEELVFDYQLEGSIDDEEKHRCLCESVNCRGTMLNMRNIPKRAPLSFPSQLSPSPSPPPPTGYTCWE